MKNKKLLLLIITIVIALALVFMIVMNNIKKENLKLNDAMDKISASFNLIEANLKTYNDNRKELSSSLDNYYTNNLAKDYNKYINLLNEQEDTIKAIETNIQELTQNCQDRLYSKKEINTICKNYKDYYETVVNIYIIDEKQVNNLIKNYNEFATTPLAEYHSTTLTDYIDYNGDGKYLEREEE